MIILLTSFFFKNFKFVLKNESRNTPKEGGDNRQQWRAGNSTEFA
jgi:hypothetical protein